MSPSTRKRGWYWDPHELEHNLALREKWRSQLILTAHESYRLRWWDGTAWTSETLSDFTLRGRHSIPHLLGPDTPVNPLTPEDAARGLKLWAALMVLATIVFFASHWLVR